MIGADRSGRPAGDAPKAVVVVLLRVPDQVRELKGRPMATFLSRWARRAAAASAEKRGVSLGGFPKSEGGAPLPENGLHWSISHKRGYVAGVAADFPIGVDIERIRPVSQLLIRRVADEAEWRLSGEAPTVRFFRFWTAKEAVVKAEGVGFIGISSCRIHSVDNPYRLTATYKDRTWQVDQLFFDGHIVALAHEGVPVDWELPVSGNRS